MTGAFIQCKELDICAVNALLEVGDFSQCYYCVPVGVLRHVIDQVDDAVFQPASIEAMNYVGNQWARVAHFCRAPAKL